MKLNKTDTSIYLEISMQELKQNNIDIHSLLTICDYPKNNILNLISKGSINTKLSNFQITSVYFKNNLWILYLSHKQDFYHKKKIKKYSSAGIHTYTNQRICKERKNFSNFYEYVNKSIYSKYISIKNGIIFIKDKSKEKYILNYLSEFE